MGGTESSNKSKEDHLQSPKMNDLKGRFYECYHQTAAVVKALESQQNIVREILEQDNQIRSPEEDRTKTPPGSPRKDDRSPKKDDRSPRKNDSEQDAGEKDGTNVDEGERHIKNTEEDLHIRDGMKTILDDNKTNALNMSRRLQNDFSTLKRLIEREFGEDNTQYKMAKVNNDRRQSQATTASYCHSCSQLSVELNWTKNEVVRLDRESKTLSKMNTELNNDFLAVKGSLDATDRENAILKQKHTDLEKKYRKLEKEKQTMANTSWNFYRNKSANAQLYCPRRGELSVMVSNEVTKQLVSKFGSMNTDLALHAVESPGDIKQDRPVVVLCINSSRLGTDVSNALAGITLSGMVAVVILHHKDIHALPNQHSDRVLTSTEYKQLGGIYDMAFLSVKGIYTCEWNTTAVENIVRFISAYNP